MLADIQRRVGVAPDGIWGPATLAAVAKALGMEADAPKALSDPAAFFAEVRKSVFGGVMTQAQVDGLNTLLDAFGRAGWGLAWAAYGLATAAWETNRSMQPVEEAYFLGDKKAPAYRAGLRYAPFHGRGFCQLTWEKNYRLAGQKLGLGDALVSDPDMALRPDIAARVICAGMAEGWFTGRKLSDTLPADGFASLGAFTASRPIINGHDKDTVVADIALAFQDALQMGGWA